MWLSALLNKEVQEDTLKVYRETGKARTVICADEPDFVKFSGNNTLSRSKDKIRKQAYQEQKLKLQDLTYRKKQEIKREQIRRMYDKLFFVKIKRNVGRIVFPYFGKVPSLPRPKIAGTPQDKRRNRFPTLLHRLMNNTIILPWCGCWVYPFNVNSSGHAHINLYRGRRNKTGDYSQTVAIHKLMWMYANNAVVPDDLVLRHTCNIGMCWNPDHLILGEPIDNIRDQYKNGTHINQTGRNRIKKRTAMNEFLIKRILDKGY